MIRIGALGAVLGMIAAVPACVPAQPAPANRPGAIAAAVWMPQAVRFPVVPAQVEPAAPWVPASAHELTDPIELAPDRAAALWLGPAELVRVRVVRGTLAAVHLQRIVGSAGARLAVDDPGVLAVGGVELVEPVGPGSVWVVAADKPTTIVVERTASRRPRLAWEVARDELRAWIDHGGELPALPEDDGGEAELRLLGARALAKALGGQPAIDQALRAWRRDQVDRVLGALRPGDDPYILHDARTPSGATVTDSDGGVFGPAHPSWRFEVEGPGTLVVDVRATTAEAAARKAASVEIRRDGVAIARVDDSAAAVTSSREPGQAFPTPAPPTTLGRRLRAVAPLAHGEHVYEINVVGAGLVRADVRRRERRLREVFATGGDLELAAARRVLQPLVASVPSAKLAAALLAAAYAEPVAIGDVPAIAAALPGARLAEPIPNEAAPAVYVRLATSPVRLPAEEARALVALVAAIAADPSVDEELRTAIVLELAERLPGDIDATPIAARLLASGHGLPAPALLIALASHLTGGARSDALSAAELAWRRHPDSAALRWGVLAAARLAPQRRLDPVLPPPPEVAPTAVRWLAGDPDDTEPGVPGATAISELPLGRELALDVPPHPTDAARLAVVRLYAVTPRDTPGPVEISIDGTVHPLLALAPAEVLAVAVAPGHRVMRVDAPVGTRAFVGAPGAGAARRASIRRLWPVDPKLVYTLPSPTAAGPVRIELRGLLPSDRARHVVWVHTDVGAPLRLVLDLRGPDLSAWPLEGERLPSGPASVAVWLPPTSRTLWLSSDDGPVFAHVSVHGPREQAAAVRAPAPAPVLPPEAVLAIATSTSPELAWVATLSATLARDPERGDLYVARATALIELGELASARRDLAAAATRLAPGDRAELDATVAALETIVEPTYLPRQPATSPVRAGDVVAPPPIATTSAELAPLVPLARRIRVDGAASAWAAVSRGALDVTPSPAADGVIAQLAERAGQPRAAATTWLRHDGWQLRVAALADLVAAIADHPRETAPLAFGVAAELDEVELSSVRRGRAVAARATRWERVRNTEDSAGFEALATSPGLLDEVPALALHRALLAAPWPEPATVVKPGTGTAVSIVGPRDIAVVTWCRRLWPTPGPDTCSLTVGLDQAATTRVTAPHARATVLSTIHVPAGRHAIEVLLDEADPEAVAAIRFLDERSETTGGSHTPIATVRRARAFLATSDHPAEIIVAGPGAIGIEVRGYAGQPTRFEITAGDRVTSAAVDVTPAPETEGIPGRAIVVTRPVERVVLLRESGSHRIRVRSDRGMVAVRFAVRVPTRAAPEVIVPTDSLRDSGGLTWPGWTLPPILDATLAAPSRVIPSAELVIGQDDLATLDSEFSALNLRIELAIEARRRHGNVWWFAELRGRRSGPLGPTTRVRFAGEVRRLPLGFAANIDLHAAAQSTPDGFAWLTRAILGVDRSIFVGQRLQIVPELDFYAAAFGPTTDPPGADPLVSSVYRRDHPLQLVGHLGVRGRPWADQFAAARIDARTNSDFASLDQIGATFRWRGIVELAPRRGPIVALSYRPTLRFADLNRGYTFWRHDISAELSLARRLRRGRVVVTLRGDLYAPSNVTAASHALSVSLRWDDWRAGERDRMPSEEPLGDYVDEVPWAASP